MNADEIKNIYRSKLIHQIQWKSFEDRPKDGDEIWILGWHNKGHFPSSFTIAAGEVETGEDGSWRVNTCDYDGAGLHCFYPNDYNNGFIYWCDKWEISIPEQLISWDCYSGIS